MCRSLVKFLSNYKFNHIRREKLYLTHGKISVVHKIHKLDDITRDLKSSNAS